MRQSNGRFARGHSGNAGGRPKVATEVAEHLNKLTAKALQLIEGLIDEGLAGEASREALKAAETVLAYTIPKPQQPQEIEIQLNASERMIDAPPPETREEWMARIQRELSQPKAPQ
jgi:hypothetical protein